MNKQSLYHRQIEMVISVPSRSRLRKRKFRWSDRGPISKVTCMIYFPNLRRRVVISVLPAIGSFYMDFGGIIGVGHIVGLLL